MYYLKLCWGAVVCLDQFIVKLDLDIQGNVHAWNVARRERFSL